MLSQELIRVAPGLKWTDKKYMCQKIKNIQSLSSAAMRLSCLNLDIWMSNFINGPTKQIKKSAALVKWNN